MAPTPSAKLTQMITTPSSKSNQTHLRTPQSKHKLNVNIFKPSPNPNNNAAAPGKENSNPPAEHPVEVVGRIRDYPDSKKQPIACSALHINPDRQSLRVKTDIGYRDFSLDGVSLSEEDDLDAFYKKFVESRINGVKLGDKCTIMMYGPTGSGKSHTMFGCAKQPGIVYRSLKDILGDDEENNEEGSGKVGAISFVQVTVLEIYNEEIYDLLSTKEGGGFGLGWPKGSASKVRLEVFGKKVKNASFIAGREAGKISKEIQKVEKRRIIKSTFCNERSSRSHCLIILDVPTVGGRLMLVDMAGSENIEQAGQNGLEAKMQTAKINQGNTALRRVVESIANGDSHVPFRDSKLTMLLQDSFEDDKSKILMILCASPDPKELHKTISTLEYGAKAKCIVRGPHTPIKEKGAEDSSCDVILGSRIAAMDQFIYKLQMENKLREKERNEAQKLLQKKEEEVSALKGKLALLEGKKMETNEDTINLKVNERTKELKRELEKTIQDCQKMANEFVEMERRKMEEKMLQQQQEFEMLRRRLEEIESELWHSRSDNGGAFDVEGSSLVRKLLETYSDDSGMVKSMDLDKSYDLDAGKRDVLVYKCKTGEPLASGVENRTHEAAEDLNLSFPNFATKGFLSTVYEEEEEEDNGDDNTVNGLDEEVQKEVIEEEKKVDFSTLVDKSSRSNNLDRHLFGPSHASPEFSFHNQSKKEYHGDMPLEKLAQSASENASEQVKDASSSRRARIQNIFTLCGSYREISQQCRPTMPSTKRTDENCNPLLDPLFDEVTHFQNSPGVHGTKENVTPNQMIIKSSLEKNGDAKENLKLADEEKDDVNVYVKWEASKENPGKFISSVKVLNGSTLADLRKLIEIYLGRKDQTFSFLVLGDPSGAPVPKDMEASTLVRKLPICNNQLNCHLACLRPAKAIAQVDHLPFSSLENKLPAEHSDHLPFSSLDNKLPAKHSDILSPKLHQHLSSKPFVNV